ncbi:MAG: hypothetical protein N3I86_07465 [Verrucomicrobiae bacterium]|nr:hypothetical protein [Verrucomicrobiae bacterium]
MGRVVVEERFLRPLPGWLWFGSILLAGWGLLTANGWLTAYAVLLLPVMASLLWFPGEPPALVFACFMQWAQASSALLYSNAYGMPLSRQVEYGGADLVTATALSLTGLLVLALGMRVGLWHRPGHVAERAVAESRQLDPGRIFAWYLGAFVFFAFLNRIRMAIPGLAQPLGALATLKWVLVFLLAHSVLTQRRRYVLLAAVAFLEFAIGILGFFSEFKNIFFLLLVALPAAPFLFRGWRLASMALLAAGVLVLGVVWTAIKQDYRDFLNQGTGEQVVLAPVPERVMRLAQLLSALNSESIREGLEQLVLRVSYVSFFALTLDHVPDAIPFERGKLWWESIEHILMPRLFFPDKPPIHDSDRVNYYSGVQVAGAERGTSISLGYMTESYVDFGPVGMFAPIFLLGAFYGFIYRFFAWRYRLTLLGIAMGTSILIFGAYAIETSNIKLVGGNMMSLLVMGAFAKVAGPWFWRLLCRPGPAREAAGKQRSAERKLNGRR